MCARPTTGPSKAMIGMPATDSRSSNRNKLFLAAALCSSVVILWSATRTPAEPGAQTRMDESRMTPPGMAYVPGGWCWIGSNDADADEDVKPMRRIFIPSFYIDRTEVTNVEFKRFQPSHV